MSAAGAAERCPTCSARCCRWPPTPASRPSGACCSAATRSPGSPAQLRDGLQGAETAISRRRLARLPRRLRRGRRRAIEHDAGGAPRPRHARAGARPVGQAACSGAATSTPRSPIRPRGSWRARWRERVRHRAWRDPSFAPPGRRAARLDRPGHRPAQPAQPRARAAAGRAGAAPPRPRPRPAVGEPADAPRPLEGPAHRARRLRARARGAARPAARAGVRARRARAFSGGEGDHRLRRRAGGPAPAHQLLGPRQPRDRRAEPDLAAWRSGCRCARASAWRRRRRCGAARRSWAAEGGTPLQVRDEVDGYLAEGAEEVAARVIELVSRPRPGDRDGPRRPRARAGALPDHARARGRAAAARLTPIGSAR